MSINTPNGILDITNAIVRVSKLEFQQATGFDTVLNNVARNTVLLSDTTEYSSATTYHNWALKLPNAWAFTADVYLEPATDGLGDHTFKLNFFNNTNTAITNGYTLGLDGTSLTLSYDGTQIDSATLPSTLNTGAWRKLFVLFERDTFAVAVDGEAVYHYVDTSGPRPRVYGDDPGYVVFYHEAGASAPRKIKNLKFINGDKWFKDPNSSNIAYIGGSVGIGTNAPTATLDVAGNTKSTNVVATSGMYGEIIGSNAISASTGTFSGDLVSTSGVYGEILGSNAISASTGTFSGDLVSTSGVYGEILGSNAISASTVSAVTVNSNVVAGNVVTTSNLEVGTANLFVDTTTSNVGVGTDAPAYKLDVLGSANVGTLNATLTYSNASANIVAWNSSTNEVIDSGLERGFTEHPVEAMTDHHTYVEGHGTYEASASSYYTGDNGYFPWEAFDYTTDSRWASSTTSYSTTTPYAHNGTYSTTDVGGTRHVGEWLQLKLPYPILLSHSNVYPTGTDRSPATGTILGSNDGEHWYKITEFSGKTYTTSTWTRIDVNATTPYQYFRMCVSNLTDDGGYLDFMEWRLFAEKPVTRMENVHISGDLSSETLQTGYIKWPKVPLKANESEGYVASSSSYNYSSTAYKAFNNTISNATDNWVSDSNYVNGVANGTDSFEGVNGSWIKIKLPQSIILSHFNFYNQLGGYRLRAPQSGRVFASNDDVTWTQIGSFSNLNLNSWTDNEPNRVDVHATHSYSSYVFLAETIAAGVDSPYVNFSVAEIELFEAATGVGAAPTSAKLQVAGSLGMAKGAEFFAGDDVVMDLPKHDRPLTKYPEVAMTAATTAGYTVSASNFNSTYYPYKAFNGLKGGNSSDVGWYTGGSYYTGTSNTYVGTERLSSETVLGEWITIELPKPIKLKETHLWTQFNYVHVPKGGVFYGKRNASDTWTRLYSYTEQYIPDRHTPQVHVINEIRYFKYFAYVATERYDLSSGISVGEWELYGTEEGDTSVDVVHRSIPNKPGQQHLEVYWDANDSNSYSFADSSNVYDLSGSGVTGTLESGMGFDTEYNAFTFDGTQNAKITGSITNQSGDWTHSTSFWVKIDTLKNVHFYQIGPETTSYDTTAFYYNTSGYFQTSISGGGANTRGYASLMKDRWYHIVVVKKANAQDDIYLNSQKLSGSYTSGTQLSLPQNTSIIIGHRPADSGVDPLDGSISNFRLFGKALNADQVRELYEYDAPRFGHRQNLVALHKGNLGVGVAHPTSRFEVAGNETLQEYPPKAMTGFENYMEGHGVFRVSQSSEGSNNGVGGAQAWKVFDDINDATNDNYWNPAHSSTDHRYGGTDGIYTGIMSFQANSDSSPVGGEWLKIEFPHKFKLDNLVVQGRYNYTGAPGSDEQNPTGFRIIGSNDDSNWYILKTVTNQTGSQDPGTTNTIDTSHPPYKYYVFHVTHNAGSIAMSVGGLKFFGTPAPSSLEDGHLTLGKALTLPRVSGHAAGAETPRAESLVVHYDTTVDSAVSTTTVVDISGEGNGGTLKGNATYSSTDRAFTFDGTGDYIKTNSPPGISGNATLSISFWIYQGQAESSDYEMWVFMGRSQDNERIDISSHDAIVGFDFRSNRVEITKPSEFTWHHVVFTYNGSGTGRQIYVDNVKQTLTTGGANYGDNLNLYDAEIFIGSNGSGSQNFQGSISNFKIWSGVALTAEEVAMEYALGRTGKAINLTDTALCLGGTTPRAQLDVRGSAVVRGNVGIGTTNPSTPFTIHSNEDIRIDGYTYSSYCRWYRGGGNWYIAGNAIDTWNTNLYWLSNTEYTGNPVKLTIMFENDESKGAKVNANTFTGQHRNIVKGVNPINIKTFIGLIVSANNNENIKVNNKVERGLEAITINETIPYVSVTNRAYDKSVFGVISGSEDPEYREDKYGRITSVLYKEEGDDRIFINSIGEGAMWISNQNGPLESGDYVTSSNIPGYGMKQDSEFLANYTVAKITMNCDFTVTPRIKYSIKKELKTVNYYRYGENFIKESEYNKLEPDTQSDYKLEQYEENVNILDEYGQIQWEDSGETEAQYKVRYLLPDGTQISEEEYTTKLLANEEVYIAAFVGVTYHCG